MIDKALLHIRQNACAYLDKVPTLAMLLEEISELADALEGKHEHPPKYELTQIGGICTNWLRLIYQEENERPGEGWGGITMQKFISAYVDDKYLDYNDALELAEQRDKEAALNFLLNLEIGAAIQARLEKND